MSALTLYQGLVNSLATAPLHTFYVFTGVEEWYVCAAAHAVINGAFIGQDEALRSFNLVELDGEDSQLPRIRQEIQTPPFFAGHKVVRVRQAKFLKGTKAQEAENSKFPLAVTARNTTLICEAESINQKSGLLKGQQVHAVNFTFANRRDAALAAQTIVRRELAASAIEIDMQALNQIILLIGVNEKQPFVRSLLQEVQKIMAYKNFRGSISLADVNKLVTRSAEARLWDVTDALMAKKVEPALKHLHEIVQDGEEPLVILGGLASFFRQLLLAKAMLDARLTLDEAVTNLSKINVHRFVAEKAIRAAPQFARHQLEKWLTACFTISQATKLGRTNALMALELLVVEVATREGKPK